jgi:hypothetical protein
MEIRPSPLLGDERGEQEKAYNIKRHLPRGTWIIAYRTAGQIVKHPDSNFCYNEGCQDLRWDLYSQE